MLNRLLMNKRYCLLYCLLTIVSFSSDLYAQAFTFSYTGPDTLDVGINCSTSVSTAGIMPIVTSNTAGATITVSELNATQSGFSTTSALYPDVTPYTIFWDVADDMGNTETFSFMVRVADRMAPTFDVSGQDDTLYFGSVIEVPDVPVLDCSDNCTPVGDLVKTFMETTKPDTCLGGEFSRTWTARDAAGNFGSFVQVIIITEDNTPPTLITPPGNGFAICENNGSAFLTWLHTATMDFEVSDPSEPITFANNAPANYDSICPGVVQVQFTATDYCGFSTFYISTWSSQDNMGPLVIESPKDTLVQCDSNGDFEHKLADWISNHASSIVSDACSPDDSLSWSMEVNGMQIDSAGIHSFFQNDLNNGCQTRAVNGFLVEKVRGLVEVNYYADDPCGNRTFVGKGAFAAIDTIGPTFTLPANPQTEQCAGGNDNTNLQNWIDNYGNLSIDEQCSTISWTNFSWSTKTGSTGIGNFNAGPYPNVPMNMCDWWIDVRFSATDGCGNDSSKIVRWSLIDTIAPVFGPLALIDTIYCPNTIPNTPNTTISDNCDVNTNISNAISILPSPCEGQQRYQVIWTAMDACGNTSTTVQSFHMLDTLAPIFDQVPDDVTMACDQYVLPDPVVLGSNILISDLCGTVDTVTTSVQNNQDPNPAVCEHYTYTVIRTFTAVDACGNSGTSQQTIQVLDNKGPIFHGYSDTSVVCQAVDTLPAPTSSDECGGASTTPVLANDIIMAGSCPDTYTLLRTWESTDICGNIGQFTQTVHVADTTKPSITGIPFDTLVDCSAVPSPPQIGFEILGADNCDDDVTIVLNETFIRVQDSTDCAYYNYDLLREWVAIDNCGNMTTAAQNISVQDTIPPVISCNGDLMLPTIFGTCEASINLPPPLTLFDACTFSEKAVNLSQTKAIQNTSGQANNTSVVDTLVFLLSTPNFAPNESASSVGNLKISLENADAEKDEERFTIFGENDEILGYTAYTNGQCGDSDTSLTISRTKLNEWLRDGTIELKLVPQGSGVAAINNICQNNSKASIELDYSYASAIIPVDLQYSINGAPNSVFPPQNALNFPIGQNTVVYTASDCSGNSSTCSLSISIQDEQAPNIQIGQSLEAYTSTSDCNSNITLPYPTTLTDNCGFSGTYLVELPEEELVFFTDPNAGDIPSDMTFSFENALPNTTSGGFLKIEMLGDFAQAGEFFIIKNETLGNLGITTQGLPSQECSQFHTTTIALTASQINDWAADGEITFSLIANNDAGTFSEFINPCGALNSSGKDGLSKVKISLEYPYAEIDFTVKNSIGDTVTQGIVVGDSTTTNLSAGNYEIDYSTTDGTGNTASVTGSLIVRDTVQPVANCKPFTIFTDAQNASTYTLNASDLDDGSYDLCSSVTLSLSQTDFTCALTDSVVQVTLIVTDTSGNTSTCSSGVRVETADLSPAFSQGLCQFDTLQLFADPAQSNANFTYMWSGPKGFMSNQINPIIPDADTSFAGTYTLVATGLTGCTATGFVNVAITTLPSPPLLTAINNTLCDGEDLLLKTQNYFGSNVRYTWYSGTPQNPTYLAETINPEYFIANPDTGSYKYYVQVMANGCTSQVSDLLDVTVGERPVPSVVQSTINICEGDDLVLGTMVQGVDITYAWTGPNGFDEDDQFPTVNQNVMQADSGTYTLTIFKNGCPADPVFTNVIIRQKPETPGLSATTPVCSGSQLNLIASTPTAAQFGWISPVFDTIYTTINELIIPTASAIDSGAWHTFTIKNGCTSDFSAIKLVEVAPVPVLSASSNSPVCEGLPIEFSASASLSNLTFEWNGANFASFDQNPSFNGAAGNYTLIAKSTAGCADTAVVQVDRVPNPVISAVSNSAPICADGTTDAILTAVVIPASGTYLYSWSSVGGSWNSVDESPVLPSVSESDNGTYTLIVEDQNGCISPAQSTVVNVQELPVIPLINMPASICEGGTVVLEITNANQYSGGSVNYNWQTPFGVQTTTQPSLTLDNLSSFNSGMYSVEVSVDHCTSDLSAQANLQVFAKPPTPVLWSNSPICEGMTLELETNTTSTGSWNWTGPCGFSATVNHPTLLQIDTCNSGNYFLTYSENGCESDLSSPHFVEIKPNPTRPVALNGGAACIDDASSFLQLNISQSSQTAGAQYTWTLHPSGDTLGLPTFSSNFQYTDLQAFSQGQYEITATANLDGCNSEVSLPTFVTLDEYPNQMANAGMDKNGCDSEPIQLSATSPNIGTGQWNVLNGASIVINNPSGANSPVTGGLAGETYSFEWSLSNGSCLGYSKDTVHISVVEFEQALAQDKIDTCFVEKLILNATQGTLSNGVWSQPTSQSLLDVLIENPTEPNSVISGLEPGNTYFFYWTLEDMGCGTSSDTVLVRSIGSVAFAGDDEMICNTTACNLMSASPLPSFETGKWTSPNPELVFASPTNPMTTVCDLLPGINTMIWTTNNGKCGDNSIDTVNIIFEPTPVAQSDTFLVGFGDKVTFDVTTNDELPTNWTAFVISPPQNGTWAQLSGGEFSYQPDITYEGEDIFTYSVCNSSCPAACSIASVNLTVAPPTSCEVNNVLTPNGDGKNDIFYVPCLGSDQFPDNEVTIFNEYGDEVYHAAPYANDWMGTYKGSPLPAGTYFYVIKFNQGFGSEAGFLTLHR